MERHPYAAPSSAAEDRVPSSLELLRTNRHLEAALKVLHRGEQSQTATEKASTDLRRSHPHLGWSRKRLNRAYRCALEGYSMPSSLLRPHLPTSHTPSTPTSLSQRNSQWCLTCCNLQDERERRVAAEARVKDLEALLYLSRRPTHQARALSRHP